MKGDKLVVAVAGPKGVGKTTFINKHLALYGRGVFRLSFAQPLKSMLGVLLDSSAFLAENKENPAYGICGRSPRYLMQTLGTEWGRNMVDERLWIEVMLKRIEETPPGSVILIDDLRFDNEATALWERFPVCVVSLFRKGFEYEGSHESEQGIKSKNITLRVDLDSYDSVSACVREVVNRVKSMQVHAVDIVLP